MGQVGWESGQERLGAQEGGYIPEPRTRVCIFVEALFMIWEFWRSQLPVHLFVITLQMGIAFYQIEGYLGQCIA